MKTLRIEEMTWQQVKQAMEQGYRRAIFALGSIEQHGPHMPLVTDTLIGDTLAVRVAEKLGHTLVAPTIRPGCSEHHMSFAGSITISTELLSALTRAYCQSLVHHGFETIFLLPSHGGNFSTVGRIAPELADEFGIKVIGYADVFDFTKVQDEIMAKHGVTPAQSGAHAGCGEASIVLAANADLMHMEEAKEGFTGDFVGAMAKIPTGNAGFAMRMENFSPLGVIGDPRGARADWGHDLIEGLSEHLAAFYRAGMA